MVVILLQLITAILLAGLGIFVLAQQPRDRLHQGFLWFSLVLSFWIACGVVANIDGPDAEIFNRLIFVFPPLIVFTSYMLVNRLASYVDKYIVLWFCLAVAVCVAIFATDLVVSGIGYIQHVDGLSIINVNHGPLYLGYIALVVISGGLVIGRTYFLYRSAKGIHKSQLQLVEIGLVGTLIGGVSLASIIPTITESSLASSYTFMTGLIVAICFAIAIVRHGLFNIRMAVMRTVGYVLSLGTLAGIYYVIGGFASILLLHATPAQQTLNVTLALVLAFLFQPVKAFFDRITNRIFYHGDYAPEAFYARLSEQLTSTNNLRTLLSRAAREIADTFKSQSVTFVMYDTLGRQIVVGTQRTAKLPLQDMMTLDDYVGTHGGGLFSVDQIGIEEKMIRLMTSHKARLLLPLKQKEKILGYILIGDSQVATYTSRDIRTLGATADELVIAIENAQSYQEIRDLNTHLQQRIDAATGELRTSNMKLRRLDETKDEFLSMASHQLRTPLTSVKGYISMVLDGDAGKITPNQRQLLSEAFSSSERMVHLISDFLNVSRLQTGKFVVTPAPTDIIQLLKEEVESLRATADARSMKLKLILPKTVPPQIDVDENKLRQVVMNFIDNALFYSHSGDTIEVSLVVERGALAVTVRDHGIGVPKEARQHLFTKFFRAENAQRQRPDGTGVGLFLAKKVIDAHGGEIIFESAEGKGSTFGFRLPLRVQVKSPVL